MTLLDFFRRKSVVASPSVLDALHGNQGNLYQRLGWTPPGNQLVNARWQAAQSGTYAYMYQSQPAVRKVVHKIADNLSQMCPKFYERVDENERRLKYDHPAAKSLRYPNDNTTADQFIYDVVADFLVYDNSYTLKFPRGSAFPTALFPWPVHLVAILGNGMITSGYRLYNLDGDQFDVLPERIMHWRGYNPEDRRTGFSPLETLRQILAEDAASQSATTELAKAGLAKPGYIKRPLEAPEWDEDDANRFVESTRAALRSPTRGLPIFEEGMEFEDFGVTPKDAEMLAGRQFTTDEVADVYGVPRGMFSDNTTEEDRDAFYSDVIAPLSKKLASVLDHSIADGIYGLTDYYYEFDLNEKLRGSPEKRFPALTAAGGAPWMTRDEVRATEGLPPLPDGAGEEIIIPLNVSEGTPDAPTLPAPNVMPIQDPNKPLQDGSFRQTASLPSKALQLSPRRSSDMGRQKRYIDEATGVLEKFYRRQLRTLEKKDLLGKAFDSERWNRELATELETVIKSIVDREGGLYVARLMGDDFDMRQVENYVKAQARGIAEKLNEVTQRDFDGDSTAREALNRAIGERSAVAGVSIGTRATVFARQEAGKQSPQREFRQQTWIADTDRHSDLDGVSVPLNSDWGGIVPGSEPNCACSMTVE